ncbi:serine protease [Virgibacillus sp. 179-BFC.A HS]|uniref:Serine protease n=1 Tax=Tigheibacillus jepli TaxID=3035914 RepID=A0ABU5CJV9_9BACI|nr:serine protease [Virgibacillus sp. 179-BFC.A HS]MDY0406599.1 serine protease [Virgibacillus sp. 179-BFC.A HS]
MKDICVLKLIEPSGAKSNLRIGNTDRIMVGERVAIIGFPHSDLGRVVLTQQTTEVGAKILLSNNGVKTKHLVLNIQARPGQSGSPVISLKDRTLVGILIGPYVPTVTGGISLGGIDPQTLHQTTHVVSTEYLQRMIEMEWNEIVSVVDIKDEEWLISLPKYQQDTIKDLLSIKEPEDAAIAWLTATTQNTSPFSAKNEDSSSYFDSIKAELYKLLCGNPEYDEERKELSGIIKSQDNRTLIVSSISGIIGSKVGLAGTFIAPVTVLLFMTISKVSINAWCEWQKENKEISS